MIRIFNIYVQCSIWLIEFLIIIYVQESEEITALVYLELAVRGGVREGTRLKDVIREQLSPALEYKAMLLLESWRPIPSSSWIILLMVCNT